MDTNKADEKALINNDCINDCSPQHYAEYIRDNTHRIGAAPPVARRVEKPIEIRYDLSRIRERFRAAVDMR
jgi:hypothetical protein